MQFDSNENTQYWGRGEKPLAKGPKATPFICELAYHDGVNGRDWYWNLDHGRPQTLIAHFESCSGKFPVGHNQVERARLFFERRAPWVTFATLDNRLVLARYRKLEALELTTCGCPPPPFEPGWAYSKMTAGSPDVALEDLTSEELSFVFRTLESGEQLKAPIKRAYEAISALTLVSSDGQAEERHFSPSDAEAISAFLEGNTLTDYWKAPSLKEVMVIEAPLQLYLNLRPVATQH